MIKAAAVQAIPAFLDRERGVGLTIEWMEKAAAQGVELLAFPELWIPGYPFWIWLGGPFANVSMVPRYTSQALESDGPELAAIAAAARRLNLAVVLGFAEKAGASLYMAQALIGPDGSLVTRRKLKPTSAERTLFGDGDGSDLLVRRFGNVRVGALNCWEHIQPLFKQALYSMGEQIHVASWPSFCLFPGVAHAMGAEATTAINTVYALEGQCYVVASSFVMTEAIRDACKLDPIMREAIVVGGGASAIFAPDGQRLTAPIAPDAEGLVIADCDLVAITIAKSVADPSGHYGRPDVVSMTLDPTPRAVLMIEGSRRQRVFGIATDLSDSAAEPENLGNESHRS
jgi:nitrilase